jgi:hypothetical protein
MKVLNMCLKRRTGTSNCFDCKIFDECRVAYGYDSVNTTSLNREGKYSNLINKFIKKHFIYGYNIEEDVRKSVEKNTKLINVTKKIKPPFLQFNMMYDQLRNKVK